MTAATRLNPVFRPIATQTPINGLRLGREILRLNDLLVDRFCHHYGRRRWSLQGGLLLASNNSQGYKETAPQDNKVSSPRPLPGEAGSLLGRNSLSTSRSLRSNSSGFCSIGWWPPPSMVTA